MRSLQIGEFSIGDTVAATTSFDQENGFAGFVEMAARQAEHTNWQAFLTYLETEGLSAIQEKHLERGLPKTGFTETYARHAKLIRLGTDPVASVPENQANAKFEINLVEVAKPNAKRLHIRGALLLDGRPLANHQVTVLSIGSPELNISRVLTNDNGTFQVSLNSPARVLFNSVSMAASTGNSAVWHSDWASLLLLP